MVAGVQASVRLAIDPSFLFIWPWPGRLWRLGSRGGCGGHFEVTQLEVGWEDGWGWMDWDGGREAGLVDQTDLVSILESGGAGSANTSMYAPRSLPNCFRVFCLYQVGSVAKLADWVACYIEHLQQLRGLDTAYAYGG